jgi:hypothetical protein
MLAVTLTIGTLVSIMFFFVGGVIGWMAKQHYYERNYFSSMSMHPEMFDEHGNVIPDEILAVRFENDYDYTDEQEEDDE